MVLIHCSLIAEFLAATTCFRSVVVSSQGPRCYTSVELTREVDVFVVDYVMLLVLITPIYTLSEPFQF